MLVNIAGTCESLASRLSADLPGATPASSRSLTWSGNRIEASENEDHDPQLVDDPEDGFLAYALRLIVWPFEASTIDHQVGVARALLSKVREYGAMAEVCADFEERL
jgi:hypothetical protein